MNSIISNTLSSPLNISFIDEWLTTNSEEYKKLKTNQFVPFDNPFYWTYEHLNHFIEFYKYRQQCDKALAELDTDNFTKLSQWTHNFELLGSQHLLMFEVNYMDWDEDVRSNKKKFIKDFIQKENHLQVSFAFVKFSNICIGKTAYMKQS